ncbi:polysaccharide deacetylase family protein [soil metagenome]
MRMPLVKRAAISVDVEQDCPPFLESMRGVEEGLPRLLAMFAAEGVLGTFFSTGRIAELYPERIRDICARGHEVGGHGYSHRRFDHMGDAEARTDLAKTRQALEPFDSRLTSFRAPNLRLPERYVPLLSAHGFHVDSSLAAYKPPFARTTVVANGITRVPVSVTSSVLRLPLPLVKAVLERVRAPVLFVHPWELVDMSRTGIRLDCRFNTGEPALANLSAIIRWLKETGYRFLTVSEFASQTTRAG